MRETWSETPVVEIPVFVPACPTCRLTRYTHVRGVACGDGASFQRVVCSACSLRYRICREPVIALPGQSSDGGR